MKKIPALFDLFVLLLLIIFMGACSATPEASEQHLPTPPSHTPMATAAPLEEATPYPDPAADVPLDDGSAAYPDPEITPTLPTPTPEPLPVLWAADYVPLAVITHTLAALGPDVVLTSDKQAATLRLEVSGLVPTARWVYALAAPFPTTPNNVGILELSDAWLANLTEGPFADVPLMMDEDTYWAISTLWGMPLAGAVQKVPATDLLQTAWDNQPAWAIIPFEDLTPQWKVLEIDGFTPLAKDFVPARYPLTISFGLTGEGTESLTNPLPILTNRDSERFTDLMLTGVTALVRGTALTMERESVTYPGEDIALYTLPVDFMHVNNEIPFTPDCPFPELYPEKLVFCSDVRYFELLDFIGTDIVEVSGDHFGDHGPEGTLFTLDMYDEVGWPYYGGGRDLEDGREPLLLEHNGNRIAILGCNAKGSEYYAPADENTPGAVACDFEWMEAEIARLRAADYLVVVTLQHIEYYSYQAQPDLVEDFGRMAAAGAVIVSGSQSHQAHGMAFSDEAFIHYGLGNLFFDQYLYCEDAACDYAFMDRHIFYDGRHLSTELIPIRFIDMARPRPMTVDERAWFLDWIFTASGW